MAAAEGSGERGRLPFSGMPWPLVLAVSAGGLVPLLPPLGAVPLSLLGARWAAEEGEGGEAVRLFWIRSLLILSCTLLGLWAGAVLLPWPDGWSPFLGLLEGKEGERLDAWTRRA